MTTLSELKSLVSSRKSELKKEATKKAGLLSDPTKLDKYVAGVFKQVSPTTKTATASKAATKIDQVDYYIDKKHPMKGFGQELKAKLSAELARPENAMYPVSEIASGLTKQMLLQTNKEGVSRLGKAYEHKRLKDTERSLLTLGLTKEKDQYSKAPLGMEGMLTYDEWREQKLASERAMTDTEYSQEGYIKSVTAATEFGAGFGAAAAFAAGQAGPQIAAPEEILTVPAAAAAGALIGGLSEAVAYPIRRFIEKTEWGSARKNSPKVADKAKVWAVEFLPEIAGGVAAEAKLLRSMGYGMDMRRIAVAMPEAKNVVLAKEAENAAKINRKKAVKNVKETDSPMVKQLSEEEEALAFLKGEKTADAIIAKTKKKTTKVLAAEKEIEAASKNAGRDWLAGGKVPVRTGGGSEELGKATRAVERERIIESPQSIYPQMNKIETVKQIQKQLKGASPEEIKAVTTKLENIIVKENVEDLSTSTVSKKALAPTERNSQSEKLASAADAEPVFTEKAMKFSDKELAEQVNKDFGEKTVAKKAAKEEVKYTQEDVDKLYEKAGNYYDTLLMKYNPGLKFDSSTEFYDAVRKLESKITSDEKVMLDAMIDEQGIAEDYVKKTGAGKEVTEEVKPVSKKDNLIKGLALFGVGSSVFSLFNAEEVEASPVAAVKTGTRILMEEMAAKKYIVPKILDDDVFHISAKEGFQRGLGNTAAGGPLSVLKNSDKLVKKGTFALSKAMSPGQVMNAIFNIGEGIMNNPAVSKASYMMAEAMNIDNGLKVMSNIFKKAGIKSAQKEVVEEFAHLAPLMEKQVAHDYYTTRTGDLTAELKTLYTKKAAGKEGKAITEDIASTKQQLAIARKNVAKNKEGLEQYHREWEATAEVAAHKHSSVRTFLAADDSAEFAKYPFLKNVAFSDAEKLAIGRIKRQMADYRLRLEEAEVRTKSGDFMHYTLHPQVNAKMMEKITGDIASAPYLKNYSRSLNSRPLMPDVFASMQHYIPDVERRIQTQTYWNSGWKKVWDKLKHIDPVKDAFSALYKGSKPFERTFGNNLTRWYANYEVFKRLFLSPSAGLKHLVKLTGDMATLGVGTTLEALPSGVKGASWRVVENTPFLRNVGRKYFKNNLSEYQKLKKQLFDAVVPTQTLRWRMSQMGFSDYDNYFTKASRLMDKVNHVGGLWINLAELVDRGTSVTAGLNMAAKKGMTAEQALYGIYDTILKNNFLGREFTARWLRDPKTKALLMFQTTPAKIFERRLVNVIRTGDTIKNMGKAVREATRTPEGKKKMLSDLRTLWRDMKVTEQEMKANIFVDALRTNQDFYGNSAIKQFARDILITGAGTIAGAAAGVNLYHHFFHVPFFKSSHYWRGSGGQGPVLSLSPGAVAARTGWIEWQNRDYNDDELLPTKIINRWMNGAGIFPDMVKKINRINKNDIPEIYQDSKFKYLFVLPSWEADH